MPNHPLPCNQWQVSALWDAMMDGGSLVQVSLGYRSDGFIITLLFVGLLGGLWDSFRVVEGLSLFLFEVIDSQNTHLGLRSIFFFLNKNVYCRSRKKKLCFSV